MTWLACQSDGLCDVVVKKATLVALVFVKIGAQEGTRTPTMLLAST
jgi:hypothetical protein